MTADAPLSPSPESNTTSSTSMSTLDLDEAVIVTEDPQYHEHLHSYQSQVYVEDDSPVIHVPPFSPYHQLIFNGPHTPPYSYNDSVKPLNLFKPRSSTRSSTKQKNLKYKSLFVKLDFQSTNELTIHPPSLAKPCRFFPTERGCPKGSLCTLWVLRKRLVFSLFICFPFQSIHDEVKHQIPSPVKESNVKEENCRKNYFPVPWRVIGGGVRVGITETEDSDLYSAANTSCPVNHSASISELENDTPIKIVSRKRSNSNPPAPSPHSLQFKVEHVCPLSVTFFFVHSNLLISIYSYSPLNLPVCCNSPSFSFLSFF